MNDLTIIITLIAVGYIAGTWAEKRHYRSIEKREREFLDLPVITIKNVDIDDAKIKKAERSTTRTFIIWEMPDVDLIKC